MLCRAQSRHVCGMTTANSVAIEIDSQVAGYGNLPFWANLPRIALTVATFSVLHHTCCHASCYATCMFSTIKACGPCGVTGDSLTGMHTLQADMHENFVELYIYKICRSENVLLGQTAFTLVLHCFCSRKVGTELTKNLSQAGYLQPKAPVPSSQQTPTNKPRHMVCSSCLWGWRAMRCSCIA